MAVSMRTLRDVARTSTTGRRARGHIRRRGGSFQVLVYAGTDPLTGKPNYLTESTRDEAQAQKILTRLLAQVDEQRNPRTRATVDQLMDRYLDVLDVEDTTRARYESVIRLHVHRRAAAWRHTRTR